MSDSVIGIIKVSYHPSGRQEEVVGYVHYTFDAERAISRLQVSNPGEYISKPLPCLSLIPGHC